ncbi:Tat protein translocase TatB subunit [Mucilaginibacter auburnensis]|uniref:Sec-independent protein translocase protein TatA n=2 Tax=Mucilaginibacter auburnensis TaxID=1457233 RepID=A0A2H9VSU2_9SPHI|nr:Tat protein translocase TatB subunit [Mucilaginibacter auburnensis]
MLSGVFLLFDIGGQELLLLLVVALVLFGGDKLPELAKGLGKGIRDFKDASEGVKREINNQIDNFEVKKREEERAKQVAEELPIENDTNRFIEEKSSENDYMAHSKPVSQDYVATGDQVEFEQHPEQDTVNESEEQQPVKVVKAQANEKTIF